MFSSSYSATINVSWLTQTYSLNSSVKIVLKILNMPHFWSVYVMTPSLQLMTSNNSLPDAQMITSNVCKMT